MKYIRKIICMAAAMLFLALFCGKAEAVAVTVAGDVPVLTVSQDDSKHSPYLTWSGSYYDTWQIFRKAPGESEYTLLCSVEDTEYTDSIVPNGTYYYKVRRVVSDDTEMVYGEFSNEVSYVDVVAVPVIESAVSTGGNGARITPQETEETEGYVLSVSGTENGAYTRVKEVPADTDGITSTGQKLGQTYYFRLQNYVTVNGVRYYSAYSAAVRVTIVFKAPKLKKITVKSVTKAQITWNKVSGVKGYYIYCSQSGKKYKKIKTVRGANKQKATITKRKNGVYYSYKVVAYGTLNGRTTEGSMSDEKGRYMDKLGYADEAYFSREKRVYGSKGKRKYTSDARARKHMKTIRVKTWDINSSGKKYTRYWTLTVNKYLADTYKQIFKEIYKGKTRFPIHDMGCYSFRTGEHSTGTAIDINPNENYMIDGKKVMAGSLWKPKSNPYSIGVNSEVAKIFNKYGFTQGIWGKRRDYMHFSYFGT